MIAKKPSPDLSAFANDYDIVGELDSPDESRIFVANRKSDDKRRRDDRTGVLITVVATPKGDEGNALTQFAADSGTLAGVTHRRLVPVLEGRWLGNDAYAVVTQRVTDPTLAQALALGENFHSTRIAAILREMNGLLEWAREHNIVHRKVTPNQIFLEPNTDRVRVAFAIAPISRLKQPGPHDDARTIARLAVAMLGGDPDIQACDQSALFQLRPGLPQRFCEATATLLDPKDTSTADDVAAFLGLISMADPLVEGETERDRIRADIIEEQRVEREKLASERGEFERLIAEERAAFDKEMAAARAEFDKIKEVERAHVENERLELQKAVTKERTELQRALADERMALLARREELEQTVAGQQAELERSAAADRAELERLRVELRRAGELEVEKKRLLALEEITGDEESVLDDEEYEAPGFAMPLLPPIEPVTFSDDTPVMSDEKILFTTPPEPGSAEAGGEDGRTFGMPAFLRSTRQRVIAGVAALVIIVGAASAIAVGSRSIRATPAGRPALRTPARVAPTGAVAPSRVAPASGVLATAATAPVSVPVVDTTAARAWMDSLTRANPVEYVPSPEELARAREARVARAAARAVAAREAAAAQDRLLARDTVAQPAGVRATPPPDTSTVPPTA